MPYLKVLAVVGVDSRPEGKLAVGKLAVGMLAVGKLAVGRQPAEGTAAWGRWPAAAGAGNLAAPAPSPRGWAGADNLGQSVLKRLFRFDFPATYEIHIYKYGTSTILLQGALLSKNLPMSRAAKSRGKQ